jgi:thiamine pyrophosphokinase
VSILKKNNSQLSYQIVAASPVADLKYLDAQAGTIICLDGAIYDLLSAGIIPDYLLGDFDSVGKEALKRAADLGVKLIYDADQNTTDLEKGLRLVMGMAENAEGVSVKIFRALSGRADHSLYNLGLLKKFHKLFHELNIINGEEIISCHENEELEFVGEAWDHMAVMGFPSAEVSSHGLRYDMENLALEIGGMQSACNSLAQSKATIKITGCALVVRKVNVKLSRIIDNTLSGK